MHAVIPMHGIVYRVQPTLRLCMYMYNVMYTCSTKQDQKTALHLASERGHHETVQLLLEKGADPNVQDVVSVLLKSSLYLYLQYILQHVILLHCCSRRLLYIMLVAEVIMRQYNCYWRKEQIPMYKIR